MIAMRSPSSPLANDTSSPAIRSQHFLVPPFQRLRFILLFSLASWLGALLVYLLLRQWRGLALPLFLREETLVGMLVYGVVAGMILGAMQWLVLRRYVPDWSWILATATGYTIWLTTLQGWRKLLDPVLLNSSFYSNPTNLAALTDLAGSTILAAVCAIWLGLTQWLVLRHYVRSSWVWVFVPSLALVVTGLLASLNLLFVFARSPLHLNVAVLNAGLFSVIQALALCSLQKRNHTDAISINRILANAPELMNYQRVQRLSRQLRLQLSQAWLNELSADRVLKYLVGVDERGAIVAYEPMNQIALDYSHQTPLPALAIPPEDNAELPPLAHYQVTFLPPAKLKIMPWRGIPLLWIGIGLVAILLIVSAIAGSL
jgi:hypothetical protein